MYLTNPYSLNENGKFSLLTENIYLKHDLIKKNPNHTTSAVLSTRV